MPNRKFYAARSGYGKCSINSMNGTAWDKIASFDSKNERDEFVGGNWFAISATEYAARKSDIEKHCEHYEIKEKILHNPKGE